jgi:hypothetical protein
MINKNTKGRASRVRGKRNAQKRNSGPRERRDGVPQTIVRYSPSVFGFPDRIMTKLRYHDTLTVTSTSGILGFQIYNWNSIYDPDATNAGHQPLYRDTYAALYDHYAVVSATATVQFVNPDINYTVMVGGVTDDDQSSTTQFNTVAEQAHAKHALLTPLSGSKSSKTFEFTWNCMDVLGIDPYTSQTYKTAVGSNPTELSCLQLFCATTTGNTTTTTVDVEIRFDCLWTELSTPSGS